MLCDELACLLTGRGAIVKATFKARRQLPDESFAFLADDLRRLVALAFPNASHDVRMELARDQFVDTVSSVRLQQRLKKDLPVSLDAAVHRAVQLEAVWGTAAATPVPSSVPERADVFAVRDRAPDAHLDLVAAMGNLGLVAERLSHVADWLARTVDPWEDGAPNHRNRAVRVESVDYLSDLPGWRNRVRKDLRRTPGAAAASLRAATFGWLSAGYVRLAFGWLRSAGLKLKPSKCFLFCSSVAFLGHTEYVPTGC